MVCPSVITQDVERANDYTRGKDADCEASRSSNPDLSISNARH